MNWISFECGIMDIVNAAKIDNADDLQKFADNLHQHIEIALQDFAYDSGFGDDYEPSY